MGGRGTAFRAGLCCLIIVSSLASGCQEDWSSRLGLRPLWRNYVHPFEAYPLERLKSELAEDPPVSSFVVLGNTDFAPGDPSRADETAVADRIMADVRSIRPQPDFIFHLGDIAENPGDAKAWDEWIRSSAPFEGGFASEGLVGSGAKRCFVLPGEGDVDDKKTEEAFLARFFRPSGQLPFSFDRAGVHFVALNSETTDDSWLMKYFGFNRQNNRIAGTQFRWLEKDLGRNEGKAIVVFIHKPMFPPVFSRHDGYCLDQHYSDRERLVGLLRKHSVKVVFMGHEPIFHWALIGETYHVITGGAGRDPKVARRMGRFHHFLYVTIDEASRLKVYCVDPERDTVEGSIQVM